MKAIKLFTLLLLTYFFCPPVEAQNKQEALFISGRVILNETNKTHHYHKALLPFGTNYDPKAIARARHVKTGGIVLTTIGVPLAAIGVSSIIASNREAERRNAAGEPKPDGLGYAFAFGLTITGAGLMSAGIPMWISGSHRLKKYRNSLQLGVGPRSAFINYRF